MAAGVSAYVLRKNPSAEVLGAVIQFVMKGNATVISVPFMQSFIDSLKNSANQILGRVAGVNGFSIADSVPGTVDPPKPPDGNGYVQAFAETLPAFLSEEGESEFVAFRLEANPIGDMRRAVVAAAARWILDNGRIVLATVGQFNVPSARTLRSVGLQYTFMDIKGLPGPFKVPPQPLGRPYPEAQVYDYYPRWAINDDILPKPD